MEFLPAYDQNKQRPVLILKWADGLLAERDQAIAGVRFASKPHALVSNEHGSIELVDVENLIILWTLIPRCTKAGMLWPAFDTMEKAYQRLAAVQYNEQESEEHYE